MIEINSQIKLANIEIIRVKKPKLFSNITLSIIESDHNLSIRENSKYIFVHYKVMTLSDGE